MEIMRLLPLRIESLNTDFPEKQPVHFIRAMSVPPSVVVRGVVVLPKEGVEAPVVGEEGAVAVAEVPLAHQVGGVALLSQQLWQAGQEGGEPGWSEGPDAASLHAGLVGKLSRQ